MNTSRLLLLATLLATGWSGYLWRQNRSLQADLSALRSQTEHATELESQQAEWQRRAGLAHEETERLRRDLQELLRLRAETARLRGELAEARRLAQTAQAQARTRAEQPVAEAAITEDANAPFQASLQARLAPGQTLLTGGWLRQPGRRTYALLTPEAETGQDGTVQVSIRSVLMELPEDVLAGLGLAEFQAEGRSSAVQTALAMEETSSLLNALSDTRQVDIVTAPAVLTLDGRQVLIHVGGVDGAPGPAIQLLPKVIPGTGEVDLAVVLQIPPAP